MSYVLASLEDLGDFGALPANCGQASLGKSLAIGRLQEKLKAKRFDLGKYGTDCKYGDGTNAALTQYVAGETEPAGTAQKYIERLGLSSADAREAAQKIATWLATPPEEGKPAKISPFGQGPAVGMGTTGTAGGAGSLNIRITPGAGTITRPGSYPPKPPRTGAQPTPLVEPSPDQFLPQGPEAPTGAEAEEVWYQKYRWYLVGGSAFLVLAVFGAVLLTRKDKATSDLSGGCREEYQCPQREGYVGRCDKRTGKCVYEMMQ